MNTYVIHSDVYPKLIVLLYLNSLPSFNLFILVC